jgi:hypothetical protein
MSCAAAAHVVRTRFFVASSPAFTSAVPVPAAAAAATVAAVQCGMESGAQKTSSRDESALFGHPVF